MENNNISINSKPGYGYTLTRTSYDLRQEINAKVIGVLKYNNSIREKLLKKNLGIYDMVDTEEGIGYITNIYSNENIIPFSSNENGLLGYTQVIKKKDLSQIDINYDLKNVLEYYGNRYLFKEKNLKYYSAYEDYIKYIDEVYGTSITSFGLLKDLFSDNKYSDIINKDNGYSSEEFLTVQSVLNNILQCDSIKHAMEKNRVGTIRPNPLAVFSGAITTNINNFSGKDTRLGLISNQMYARTLHEGASFNSLRKTKYITPEAYKSIGNKLSTIANLDADFRIDEETGRLAFEIGDIYESNLLEWNNGIWNDNAENLVKENKFRKGEGKEYEYDNISKNLNGITVDVINQIASPVYYEDDVKTYDNEGKKDTLLSKTQQLFDNHGVDYRSIDTLISRFHTSGDNDIDHNKKTQLQSAVSQFGMSHGRNLLTKDAYELHKKENTQGVDKTNGYENPYCRTWTHHHQYDNISKLIRPFSGEDGEIMGIDNLQSTWYLFGRRKGSAKRLFDETVLNKNGFVNITPSITSTGNNSTEIKKCMFSIENLAWKDINKDTSNYDGVSSLSPEQRGPNGGRIMWFPPYGLRFNENVSANWNSADFIGRGEKVYTYTNTERTGTLSFTLLVDHPSIIDMWRKNGVDRLENDEDREQRLLRFFAGCDTLELDNKPIYEDVTINVPEIPEKEPEVEEVIEDKSENLEFYIFFPNNYTGKDNDENEDKVELLLKTYEVEGKETYEGDKNQYLSDEEYDYEKLLKGNNKDNTNFKLNDNLEEIKKNKDYSTATHSFKEFNDKISEIKSNYTINTIEISGYASSHGEGQQASDKNIKLAKRRADFAKKYLVKYFSEKDVKYILTDNENKPKVNVISVNGKDVSTLEAKLARCAKVVINTNKLKTYEKTLNILQSDKNLINTSNNFTSEWNQNIEKKKKEKEDEKYNKLSPTEKLSYNTQKFKEEGKIKTPIQPKIPTFSDLKNVYDSKLSVIHSSFVKREIKGYDESETRWENEAQYFQMLQENDSFLYNKIIDKIKYFTPAFHSITPEGFNARLAFLHQCTRQGSTLNMSDNQKLKSAGNLSFGRPPICVLRIGDFYHTKIIISSITIDYGNDAVQWDMNPEGIGMQPIFANININFTFLGGSDLGAPISRLQNAVSFNYYANQSVYDNRSDIGEYKDNKPRIKGNPWTPNIDNINNKK